MYSSQKYGRFAGKIAKVCLLRSAIARDLDFAKPFRDEDMMGRGNVKIALKFCVLGKLQNLFFSDLTTESTNTIFAGLGWQ